MPYNNTPIPPPTETTGSVSLPLARVKKIINADEDIQACSANAAFAIAVATEEFVYYLTEQAHRMAKAEKKPKRSLGYQHVQAAISRLDNLEFLTDVVPKQVTFKEAKAERARKEVLANNAQHANGNSLPNGQQTLPGASVPAVAAGPASSTNGQATAGAEQRHHHTGTEDDNDDSAMQVDSAPVASGNASAS